MKNNQVFRLEVNNTSKKFTVNVFDNKTRLVYTCGWHGGKFEFEGKNYVVNGPYQDNKKEEFGVYELVPVSNLVY